MDRIVIEWRPVVTHPTKYEVSNTGMVRSIVRDVRRGKHMVRLGSVILAQSIGGRAKNYKRVMLMGPRRHAYVHHLMAEAFLGPRPPGLQVLHKDDDGFHNILYNLRYGDRDENEADRHVAKVASKLPEAPF